MSHGGRKWEDTVVVFAPPSPLGMMVHPGNKFLGLPLPTRKGVWAPMVVSAQKSHSNGPDGGATAPTSTMCAMTDCCPQSHISKDPDRGGDPFRWRIAIAAVSAFRRHPPWRTWASQGEASQADQKEIVSLKAFSCTWGVGVGQSRPGVVLYKGIHLNAQGVACIPWTGVKLNYLNSHTLWPIIWRSGVRAKIWKGSSDLCPQIPK